MNLNLYKNTFETRNSRAGMSAPQLASLLYAIGMESPTAWAHMAELCAELHIPYPPQSLQEKQA